MVRRRLSRTGHTRSHNEHNDDSLLIYHRDINHFNDHDIYVERHLDHDYHVYDLSNIDNQHNLIIDINDIHHYDPDDNDVEIHQQLLLRLPLQIAGVVGILKFAPHPYMVQWHP